MTHDKNVTHKVRAYKRRHPQLPKSHIRRVLMACARTNLDPELIFRRYGDKSLSETRPERFDIAFKMVLHDEYSR